MANVWFCNRLFKKWLFGILVPIIKMLLWGHQYVTQRCLRPRSAWLSAVLEHAQLIARPWQISAWFSNTSLVCNVYIALKVKNIKFSLFQRGPRQLSVWLSAAPESAESTKKLNYHCEFSFEKADLIKLNYPGLKSKKTWWHCTF